MIRTITFTSKTWIGKMPNKEVRQVFSISSSEVYKIRKRGISESGNGRDYRHIKTVSRTTLLPSDRTATAEDML